MDHGVLNLPLARRCGDIDQQIDRYKAAQARDARAAAKEQAARLKADRAQAKAVLASWSAEKFEAMGKRLGITAAAARKELAGLAYWQPAKLLASFSVPQAEGVAA